MSLERGGLHQELDLQKTAWSSGQGMPIAALFLVKEKAGWACGQNCTKCVVVYFLSLSYVAIQLLEEPSLVLWCVGAQVLNQTRQIWV